MVLGNQRGCGSPEEAPNWAWEIQEGFPGGSDAGQGETHKNIYSSSLGAACLFLAQMRLPGLMCVQWAHPVSIWGSPFPFPGPALSCPSLPGPQAHSSSLL